MVFSFFNGIRRYRFYFLSVTQESQYRLKPEPDPCKLESSYLKALPLPLGVAFIGCWTSWSGCLSQHSSWPGPGPEVTAQQPHWLSLSAELHFSKLNLPLKFIADSAVWFISKCQAGNSHQHSKAGAEGWSSTCCILQQRAYLILFTLSLFYAWNIASKLLNGN